MRVEAVPAGEFTQVESIAATGVENGVGRRGRDRLRNGVEQRRGDPAIVQAPARGHGSHRIARVFGTAVLRLQQVDVTAARDVEGMPARARQAAPIAERLRTALQRQVAIADRAQEHSYECNEMRAASARKPRGGNRYHIYGSGRLAACECGSRERWWREC